jgi:hypothetical protein
MLSSICRHRIRDVCPICKGNLNPSVSSETALHLTSWENKNFQPRNTADHSSLHPVARLILQVTGQVLFVKCINQGTKDTITATGKIYDK